MILETIFHWLIDAIGFIMALIAVSGLFYMLFMKPFQ